MRKGYTVFLGQPGYGEVTAGAARGFWRATCLPTGRVFHQYNEGSLLAANFNQLWCTALNFARQGHVIDYFAMIHSDIEPRDWWLDDLISELEAHDLDLLGVVAPIKDPNGLTSIALDRPDGDHWRPLCRLTTAEVRSLPPTFTSSDVGHRLLVNTGLWVCRFSEDWARKVHFEINDRIVQTPDGNYVPQTEPEDWYFSRLCHELGLRVGATRKIPLLHRGPASFPNDRSWGNSFDGRYVPESVLPADPPGRGFRFPRDVEGWLSYDEGKALYELARDRRVLEIGSYCGRSTICLAQSAASVVAVDHFDGRATPNARDTLEEFESNIEIYGLSDRITAMAPEDYWGGPFDLVFIDGDHEQSAVEADIGEALHLLAPGGLLAFHDYRINPGQFDGGFDPGVTRAVNHLLSRGGEILSTHDSVAVVKPPAKTLVEV